MREEGLKIPKNRLTHLINAPVHEHDTIDLICIYYITNQINRIV